MSSNLFQTQDVFGNDVCLPNTRWHEHILVIHPEVQPFLAEIEDAIRNPHCIYTSWSNRYTKLFYKRGITQGKYRNLSILRRIPRLSWNEMEIWLLRKLARDECEFPPPPILGMFHLTN